MANLQYLFLLFLIILSISAVTRAGRNFPQFRALQPNNNNNINSPYRHVEILDPAGRYRLEWLVDWENQRIFFNATVQTRGWVGFGLSREAKMTGADVIMGGIDWTGRPYFTDRHAIGNQVPLVDVKQDWKLHSAWETQTHTILSFSRAFDTCDSQDIPITDDTLNLLWAYGETDDTSEYHRGNRGSVPIYLRDPDLTPRIIQENRLGDPATLVAGSDVSVWTIRNNFNIPAKRTTYWCNVHRGPAISQKHHIIGFTYRINNQTTSNMHHMLLYRCVLPNPSAVFEQFVNHPGEECYSPSNQLGVIPFQSCTELKAGHAIGGRPIFFPESMGIPIGTTGQTEYYMMQTHYDNPTGRSDLVAETQLDIYYSTRVRPNDGGILSLGHHIPGSPSILLPPGTTEHRLFGHCSSSCTRRMLPPQGIKIVGGLIHAHNAGRRLTLQHFRNNRELPHILSDDNWKINFQPIRLLRNEVTIMPGDQMSMRCYYDTTHTNRTTVGGYGTDQEMCKTFAVYYGLLEDYPICRSELISPEYTARYLAGTTNVTWDQSRLEFMATVPPHLAGMTLSQISDSPFVNWTPEQRALLKRDHVLHPHVEICPSRQEAIAAALTGVTPPPTFVTYPVQASEYRPPQQCSLIR